MQSAIQQFRENMLRVRHLGGLYLTLGLVVGPIVDSSDVLRAQYVMAVSALDHYVHEVVRLGILEIYDGKRTATAAYGRLKVSLTCFDAAVGGAVTRTALETDIRDQHSYLSFQKPDRVGEALKLISDEKVWDLVAATFGRPLQDVKDQLTLIVDRRNKIVHEADLDPTYPNVRWPITTSDINQIIEFIDCLAGSIQLAVQ